MLEEPVDRDFGEDNVLLEYLNEKDKDESFTPDKKRNDWSTAKKTGKDYKETDAILNKIEGNFLSVINIIYKF